MDSTFGTVRQVAIYPVKGEPGRRLERAALESAGLEGDRRKKRPVHLVGAPQTPETTRANVFLDVADDELRAALGSRIRLGSVVLSLDELPSGCPGVYASVVTEGSLQIADEVTRLS